MNQLDKAIPASKDWALLQASYETMQQVAFGNRQKALDMLARSVHDILEAESAALFLMQKDSSENLMLAAAFSDREGALRTNLSPVKIRSLKAGGLTGHIAATGNPVRMSGAQVWQNRHTTKRPPAHLHGGIVWSLLAIPLRDRKGRLMGVLKAENRKGSDGTAGEGVLFKRADEVLGEVLGDQTVALLENLSIAEVSRGLLEDIKHDRVTDGMLQRIAFCLKAERGVLALWRDEEKDLIAAAVYGERPHPIQKGTPVPATSIHRNFWDNPDEPCRAYKNPSEGAPNGNVINNSEIGGAIGVRLQFEGRCIGVLALESSTHRFDDRDEEVLLQLANSAAVAIRLIENQSTQKGTAEGYLAAIRSIEQIPDKIRQMPSEIGFDPATVEYRKVVFHGLRAFGFERGFIFDFKALEKQFQCVASYGPENEDFFRGLSIALADNPYARHLAKAGSEARTHDPGDPGPLGEDPDAATFERPGDLPWAAVPVIVDGQLYGQITVDNKTTGKSITAEALQFLALLAKMVSKALSQFNEKERAEQEVKFRAIWDNSVDGMRLTDAKGHIIDVNPAFCKLVGLERQDLVRMPLSIIYSKDRRPAILGKYIEQFQKEAFPPAHEADHELHSGAQVRFQSSHSILRSGKAKLKLSIFRDITAEHLARTQLEEAQAEIKNREFYQNASHEIAHQIRNPLFAQGRFIKALEESFNSILSVSKMEKERINGLLQRIATAGDRIECLITRIRNVAIQSQSQPKSCKIHDIIQEVWKDLNDTDPEASEISFSWDGPIDLCVCVDHILLSSALDALLSNAIKYGKPKGGETQKIKCAWQATTGQESGVDIIIGDSGPGLIDAVSQNLGAPFKKDSGGTGLGLAIACNHLRLTGGHLKYLKKPLLGIGCGVFVITLQPPAESLQPVKPQT